MNKIVDSILKEVRLVVEDKGYNIDNISYFKTNKKNKRSKLLIHISKINASPVTVKDCSKVSRLISMVVELNNIVTEAYNLVISSKGCDDSLFFLNDYTKNIGKLVKVNLKNNNKKNTFNGRILKTSNNKVFFNKESSVENSCISFSINKIQSAVLIKDTVEGVVNERSKGIR